ncbi:MAG: hypothetical protein Alis3KO_41490 [Aliiglaciecola sp.]
MYMVGELDLARLVLGSEQIDPLLVVLHGPSVVMDPAHIPHIERRLPRTRTNHPPTDNLRRREAQTTPICCLAQITNFHAHELFTPALDSPVCDPFGQRSVANAETRYPAKYTQLVLAM